MVYNEYAYLWPPRPEQKIPQGMLKFYENRGFLAQVKKNGTCTVIFAKGKEVIFKTRHNDDHKLWSPTPEHIRFFQTPSNNWNVYVAELIHSKVSGGPKNQLYIFDKIVDEGIHLVGTSFEDRQLLLKSQWEPIADEGDSTRIHDYISVANNFAGDFAKLFMTLKPEDEGLVLKNPKAVLKACMKQDANNAWQVKCRIPHKNYSFLFIFSINSIISLLGGLSWVGSSTFGMI